MRISDWSSDVCSSDLREPLRAALSDHAAAELERMPGAGLRSPCRPQLPLMARRIGIGALAGRRTVTAAEFVVVVVVARAELPAGAQRTGEFEIDAVADAVRIAELETPVRIVVVPPATYRMLL